MLGVFFLIDKCKVFSLSVLLTAISYSIAYLLSSKEILFDYKNIFLMAFFSLCWAALILNKTSGKCISVLCCISIIIGFIVPGIAFEQEPLFLQRLVKDFLYWYSLPLVFIFLVALVADIGVLRYCLIVCYALYSVISFIPLFVIIGYYFVFSSLISVDGVMALLQTNVQESMEFIRTYINIPTAFVGFCALTTCLYLGGRKLYYELLGGMNMQSQLVNKRFFTCTLLVVFVASNFAFGTKAYWHKVMQEALKRERMARNFENERVLRETVLSKDEIALKKTENGIYALVIGETHSRSNMSAYGYKRDTTPWLKSAIMNGEVFLLNNGFSNSAQTTPSLAYALTAKNQYNDVNIQEAFTVSEIAKACGFEVIWVSNQIDDNIAGRIGHEADRQYWLNLKHNDTWMRQKNSVFDDKIIECLENIKEINNKTLIVINLLGSHASYNCRYPEEFERWNDNENLLNAYDNSVLYNDYVMKNIYRILFEKLNTDAMIYFADHGEELDKKYCHGNEYFKNNYKRLASAKEIVKIPVYFAFSERYCKRYPDRVKNVINNKEKYFTNDMIYDTLLGIMQVRSPYYNSIYDITSKSYKLELDDLKTLHGEVQIKDCL